MDRRSELRSLQRQLDLANRAARQIVDEVTVHRLEGFAQEIARRLTDLEKAVAEEETRSRAHYLWREAGCPAGRDLEFWLQAEQERTSRKRGREPA